MSTQQPTWTTLRLRKLEAVSGVVLLAFVTEHACANALLILPDPEWFDGYVHSMSRWWTVRIAEFILACTFIAHISGGWVLRKRTTAVLKKRTTALQSQPMTLRLVGFTGTALLIFLVLHVSMFVAPRLLHGAAQPGYYQARLALSSLPVVVLHCAAMVALVLHLRYGIAAAITVFPGIPKPWIPAVKRWALRLAFGSPLALAAVSLAVFLSMLLADP
jgi:succinate dehydrogenase/fumarate reductase cytochrome b subunit (b558 family)